MVLCSVFLKMLAEFTVECLSNIWISKLYLRFDPVTVLISILSWLGILLEVFLSDIRILPIKFK